jgi:histone-lysine N-methyltransferase SETMAR
LHYEFKLGHSATVAAENINRAYGSNTVDVRVAQLWFSRFRAGDESLEEAPRSGRPSIVDEEALLSLVEADPRQTLATLADTLKCSIATVDRHLHALGKVRKLEKWVPHKLTADNKTQRLTICTSLLSRHQREPFFKCIITCDEKWVLYDNTKRGYVWLSPDEPTKTAPKPPLHQKKLLLCVWWSMAGVIHHEVLKVGETITADVYCQQLQRASQALLNKQPALVNRRQVLLLHDNAPAHTAKKTQGEIRKLNWEVLPHPPYSPDLSPTDYHLFRSLANYMREKQFKKQEEVTQELQNFFSSKDAAFFENGIEDLLLRWTKVVDNNGDYFME